MDLLFLNECLSWSVQFINTFCTSVSIKGFLPNIKIHNLHIGELKSLWHISYRFRVKSKIATMDIYTLLLGFAIIFFMPVLNLLPEGSSPSKVYTRSLFLFDIYGV